MKISLRLLACGLAVIMAGCATPTEEKKSGPTLPAGFSVYSETSRANTAANITSDQAASNNTASITLDSTEVTAAEGTKVVKLNPGTGTWGGGYLGFTAIDVSSYSSLVFSLNTSALSATPTYLECKVEISSVVEGSTVTVGNTVEVMGLEGVTDGDWTTYTIDLDTLKDAVGPGYGSALLTSYTAVKSVGFWNPKTTDPVTGALYIDDIHFE